MTELEKAKARLADAELMLRVLSEVEITAAHRSDDEMARRAWKHAECLLAQDVVEAAKAVRLLRETLNANEIDGHAV